MFPHIASPFSKRESGEALRRGAEEIFVMSMHYQRNPVWRDELEKILNAYRRTVMNTYMDSENRENGSQQTQPESRLLDKVEEKIRDAKHFIRRCRKEHVWMPALIQGPNERLEIIPLNPHSLDAHHRYGKALQRYKRRLDRYERIKDIVREKAHAEEER